MAIEKHGNRFRAVIYDRFGKRIARQSFPTKSEAQRWEKSEKARQHLSAEERAGLHFQKLADHFRFVPRPDFMKGVQILQGSGEKQPYMPRTHSPNSMLIYVEDKEEPVQRKPRSTLTLKAAMETYLVKVVPTHKPKTQEPEAIKIRKILRDAPVLCGMQIVNQTRMDFQRYRDDRLKEVSPSTVKGECKLLSRVIQYARDEMGVEVTEDPAGRIRHQKGADKERDRRLIEGEEELLLEKASPIMRDLIIVALDTGMRESEIVEIDPKWFQKFGTPRAHLRLPTETKTDKPRSVPVSVRV
ncbi:MAG TPA: hypothetical protein VGZ72_05375, partial [Stellaceae bacterium]|nr:hypothetical protein [Stellaceae bacterium]